MFECNIKRKQVRIAERKSVPILLLRHARLRNERWTKDLELIT
jgi:hypothetical protein